MTSELCLQWSGIFSQPLRSVPVRAFISAWQVLIWMHKWTHIPCGKIINWAVVGLLHSQSHVCVCAAGNHADYESAYCPAWGYGFQTHELLLLDRGPPLPLSAWKNKIYTCRLINAYHLTIHLSSSDKRNCVCVCRYRDKELPYLFPYQEPCKNKQVLNFFCPSLWTMASDLAFVGSGKSQCKFLLILTFKYEWNYQ